MVHNLLDFPAEVRLMIWSNIFGIDKAIVDAGLQAEKAALLPQNSQVISLGSRSGQLLRVCKLIWNEAEPILYANTLFVTSTQSFAGKLPSLFSDGNYMATRVQHLTWQMSVDLLKHFYAEDFEMQAEDLMHVTNLELWCSAETWKGSFRGMWYDQDAILRGREEMIEYARNIRSLMATHTTRPISLIEEPGQMRRGRIIVKLRKGPSALRKNELLIKS